MSEHLPILKNTIKEYFSQFLTEWSADPVLMKHRRLVFTDLTFGGGGHSLAFLQAIEEHGLQDKIQLLGVDQDPSSIQRAQNQKEFQNYLNQGSLSLVQSRFSEVDRIVGGFPWVGFLADLGFSSDQMNDPKRGLSFKNDGPLDMRLNPQAGVPVSEFLKSLTETELIQILSEFGEERFSKRIANSIILQIERGNPIETTQQLAQCVVSAIPSRFRHGRVHAATRTFQALRIAVNQELQELDAVLEHAILKLIRGGVAMVMSFHSLEDRKVKRVFKDKNYFKMLTKKPIVCDEEELLQNPRARSAKLRIARRL